MPMLPMEATTWLLSYVRRAIFVRCSSVCCSVAWAAFLLPRPWYFEEDFLEGRARVHYSLHEKALAVDMSKNIFCFFISPLMRKSSKPEKTRWYTFIEKIGCGSEERLRKCVGRQDCEELWKAKMRKFREHIALRGRRYDAYLSQLTKPLSFSANAESQ